ncbi:tRNA lysidine(34) synthetase TilS [Albibacterium profundi]|uniref:tRNA(Ile)-lysidine synthase n=1 Tax=Albibacterium profundi TaxID=3134906 RepID=A0ABV5CEH1_9SPHI
MRFVDKFMAFIADNHLFEEEQRVILAVSGGKDSVLMADLFAEARFNFAIAHCNFRLRGKDSDQDEEFVRNLAQHYKVPFYSVQFATETYAYENHISIQMAARDLRYDWLESLRQKEAYDYVAVAHHQTDSVETVLLNLLRGTGVAGLVGIAPKRDFIVRPLLAFSGREVKDELVKRRLEYREDISNASTKYKRNKIRLDVLPHLRELNQDLEKVFDNNGKRFSQLNRLLTKMVDEFRADNFQEQKDGRIEVSLDALKKLDPVDLWIYELFHPYGFSEMVLGDLISSWDHGSGKRFLSAEYQLLLDRGRLIMSSIEPCQDVRSRIVVDELPFEFTWYGEQYVIRTGEKDGVELTEFPVMIDAVALSMPLFIRSWQQGDKFQPLGMRGKKKVSDLLIEQKVPLTKKAEVPLLVDSNDNILAVWPWRINDQVKITPKTKKVLIFEKLKNG